MLKANYYELLGISITGSLSEINKAYKLKALQLHPDKNRSDPLANEKFHELGEAYAVLSDEKAKALYDTKLRIEEEKRKRDELYDSKRKMMKDSLLAKEKEAAKKYKNVEDEMEIIKEQFQAELDRIRKKQRAQEKAHLRQFYSKYAPEELDQVPEATTPLSERHSSSDELSMRTIFVKWGKSSHIDQQSIERVFQKYGSIETVVLKPNENSAILLCSTYEMAMTIMNDQKGLWRQIYSVSWAKEAPSKNIPAYSSSITNKQRYKDVTSDSFNIPSGSYRAYISPFASLSFEDYEKQTLDRLRNLQAEKNKLS